MDPFDHELEERFRALERRERVHAPPFDELIPRRVPKRGARAARWSLAVAAAGAALWLGGRVAGRVGEPEPAVAIAIWRAPTDALLATPARALLRELPRLHASVLDRFIPSSVGPLPHPGAIP